MEFIHLSDLHFKENDPFQMALIDALLKDIEGHRINGLSPDLIVFSGDLVNNPNDKDIYVCFENQFLIPLLEKSGLKASQVVFCPGNHDLSFEAIQERTMIYDALQTQGSKQAYLAAQCASSELKGYVFGITSGFFDLAQRFGGDWQNPFWHIYDYPELGCSFIALNTAFSCSLQGSKKDRGALTFPVSEALKAFQTAAKDRYILSLGHHPLTDLNEETARSLVPIIEKRSHIHLFGHVHQPKPSALRGANGSCFFIQSGALYETGGYYNGYSIVRISDDNAKHTEVSYQTYYVDRQEFDVGTNVAKGGTFLIQTRRIYILSAASDLHQMKR